MKLTKILCVVVAVVLMLPVTVVSAASPEDGATGTTTVSYSVAESEWTWSVPAAQTFTAGNLSKTGDVAISPTGSVITLPSGTVITVTMATANGFKLVNSVSEIPYTVSANASTLATGAEVLRYTAGTSANTGVANTLTFATTVEDINAATLTGAHTDTLTFTLHINP